MNALQKAVVDLVRLGLKGETSSVHQLASRLLRQPPSPDGQDAEWREALAHLLATAHATRGVMRGAAQLAQPIDENSYMSLVQIEQIGDVQPACLSSETTTAINEVLQEHFKPDLLATAGIEPTRTLLFTGPPGVGKTMTARYLAGSLGLPLVVVNLAAIMSSLLGKTGQNLKQVLDYARATHCVFLLDEFDALGKRRDDPSDVGELKRIVNVLLLELEKWPASTLLIAATNHPELLDRAVWRRFDRVIELALPDAQARAEILKGLFSKNGNVVNGDDLQLCVDATRGYSGSDLARLVREVSRSAALRGHREIGSSLSDLVLRRLLSAARDDDAARSLYCGVAASRLKMTQREIAKQLGVSHVTVGKLLKQRATNQRADTGSA